MQTATTATALELFGHVRIVMGMVIGLGVTRLLLGVSGLVQHARRARLSLIHLLWALSILVELILFWWWEFDLRDLQSWSFGTFAFLIGYAITLFLLAALLFPDKMEDYSGYGDFFFRRRKWFFGLLALTFVFDVVETLIKGAPYFDTIGIEYLIQVPMGLAICAFAIRSSNPRFHLGLVLVHLTYQAFWIGVLFDAPI
jgi:hypothetical protein